MCRGGSGESGKLTVINEEGFPIASYSHLPVGLEVKVHIEKRSVLFPTHPVVQVVIIKASYTNPRSVHNACMYKIV